MPHVTFTPGLLTATGDSNERSLIPGVEPGMGIRNIFAQQRMKRALIINRVWGELITAAVQDNGANVGTVVYHLKLSQENGLDPGLLLPVFMLAVSHEAAAADSRGIHTEQLGDPLAGTLWAPRLVGVRAEEGGSPPLNHQVIIHLDYDVVEVPWQRWFIMWDFLDNVVNNERQY